MSYYKPTPRKWRKLGDSLLAVGAFITGYGALADNDIIVWASLALGVGGKFLTNFFSEDELS